MIGTLTVELLALFPDSVTILGRPFFMPETPAEEAVCCTRSRQYPACARKGTSWSWRRETSSWTPTATYVAVGPHSPYSGGVVGVPETGAVVCAEDLGAYLAGIGGLEARIALEVL